MNVNLYTRGYFSSNHRVFAYSWFVDYSGAFYSSGSGSKIDRRVFGKRMML